MGRLFPESLATIKQISHFPGLAVSLESHFFNIYNIDMFLSIPKGRCSSSTTNPLFP